MRKLLKFVGILIVLLLVVVGVMYFMGSRLPVAHTASASAVVHAPQQRVWSLITDTAGQPSWRTGLKSVQILPPQEGHPCWNEVQSMGKMPLCESVAAPPTLRVVRIADPSLPFGGTWTYQLVAVDPDHTNVTITENGTTGPALFRFLGHYVFHEDTQIKQYLSALEVAAPNQ